VGATRLVPTLPRQAWIVLGGDVLSAIGSGLTLPFFVVYLHRVRGIELDVAGLALATIAFASLAGNPTGGFLADRLGPRRAVVAGLVVAAAGTASIAFVSHPWQAFAAAALTGFGLAVVWPALDSLLAVTVRPGQRSSVFAVRHATLNAGFGIGALVAATIVEFDSARTFQLLYLLDAASFLAFVPVLLVLKGIGGRPETETVEPGGLPGYRLVLQDRAFLRVAALTVVLYGLGYAQLNAAFPAFATGRGGISAGALGIAFAVNTLAVTVLQLPVLRLAQGRRRTAALFLVFVLWATTWAVTLVAGEVGGGAAAVSLFAAAVAIFALGETLLSPALAPLVNDLAPDRLRGRYNAVYALALTTGYILGPVLAGAALGAGLATAFFLALVAACLVSAVAALRLERSLPAGVDLVGRFRTGVPEPAVVPAATTHG
jgi:MFS family permease